MDDKYKLFLKQNKFDSKIVSNSILTKLEVSKKIQVWSFYIALEEVISMKDADKLIETIKTWFSVKGVKRIEVHLEYKKTDNFDEHSSTYWDLIIKKLTIKKGRFSAFQNFKVECDKNNYCVIVDKDTAHVKNYFDDIKEEFRSYGLNIDVLLQISEELKPVTEMIEDDIKDGEKVLIDQAKANTNIKESVIKKSFTRKTAAKKVYIAEIPIDQYHLDKYQNEKGDLNFIIEGQVIKLEVRKLTNMSLLSVMVADKNDAIVAKRFLRKEKDFDIINTVKEKDIVKITGRASFDTYQKEVVIFIDDMEVLEATKQVEKTDKATKKRVELHLHTKMSNMDAVTDAKTYIETLEKWGHSAVAFTDHNGLYAYPEISKAIKGKKIKPIYGVELDFVDEDRFMIASGKETGLLKDLTYVVFDIETTGLSVTRDKIIEIAAVKVLSGTVIDSFHEYINPKMMLSDFTTQLTGITDEMLVGAKEIKDVLPKFMDFIKNTVLVAHNAKFDTAHIYENARVLKIKHEDFSVIDTLSLARCFYADKLKRFNLKALSNFFKVKLDQHHRADSDTNATAQIFLAMLNDLSNLGIKKFLEIDEYVDINDKHRYDIPYHANLLVKNQIGYKNLFKIVSDSLTTHFHHGARATKKFVTENKEGILIGSGCMNGDVFEAARNLSDEELKRRIEFYDYIEVQPPSVYKHLFDEIGKDNILLIIEKIIKFAKEAKKIVIATGDVHYLNKEDKVYREIYVRTKLVGGGIHRLSMYDEIPDQHLLTTHEMLEEFSFLDKDLAEEIVITNTNLIADMIESIVAFPKELFSIKDDAFKEKLNILSIKVEVEKLVTINIEKNYGKNPHPIVTERTKRELKNIIENEFAPIYYMSHLLVKKSLDDGYLVGSRGSVGSSFVATMLNITEVNPLKPHYRCKNGDFTVFKLTKEEIAKYGMTENEEKFQEYFKDIQSGYDLENQVCPVCGKDLVKDGHDIPFETFLGFDGDKVPDIDLNFSGDYQAKAHTYVRDLLGEDHTFRAGTIQTVAERNAYGYVKGYLEDKNIEARSAQIERLAKNIEGVKRSSGQHPGGIVVVPSDKSIFDVTPIQFPADDVNSDWKTTHFDYHSFEDNLLKLDILGHDDPTLIKFLMDYVLEHQEEFSFNTAQDIPIDDKKVYKLFSSTSIIGLTKEDIDSEVASFAIPEFGTPFTRQMLTDTKPKTFAGFLKISGLSHGTDVWLKNGQSLVLGKTNYGKIEFNDIIACRDDIMVQLIDFGLDPLMAFDIMEFVRKGKPSKDKKTWGLYEAEMKKFNVPEWYIWSASQIKYMFPKAHATAYVIMAMRIAWFKLYKPLLFYSGFFSKRADQFDYEAMTSGSIAIRNVITGLNNQGSFNLKVKDESLIVTLGVALEMTKRGFKFLPVDLMKSDATTFIMETDGLRMPFVTIDGLGETAAYDIIERRKEKEFTSKKDIKSRTKINKTIFEKMENYGILDGFIEESAEIDSGLFAL